MLPDPGKLPDLVVQPLYRATHNYEDGKPKRPSYLLSSRENPSQSRTWRDFVAEAALNPGATDPETATDTGAWSVGVSTGIFR
jgi:hypothetical protein